MIKCFFSGAELPDGRVDCYIFGDKTRFVQCLNCKWYKTREQFLNDQRNAELLLHQRGIKSIIKFREDGEKIVTTEKYGVIKWH